MRLTALGTSAGYAGAGRACAGFLVENDSQSTRVLLDCGNGVLGNLGRLIELTELDAVVITHMHPDHFLDLYSLETALRHGPGGSAPPLPLYAPAGLLGQMKSLLSKRSARELEEAFVPHALATGEAISIGDLVVTPVAVEHSGPTFALRVVADGALLAYSADAAAGPWLLDALRDADLALVEATLAEEFAGRAAHLTAREAGVWARQARVLQLVLTHLWPTNDREAAAREAAAGFGAPVRVATEMDGFTISAGATRF